jgi:hypothetical protein
MSDMRVIARTAKTKEQVRSMRHCMRGITADLKVGATLPADLKSAPHSALKVGATSGAT